MVAGALRKYGFGVWFCLLTCMPYLLSSKLFGAALSTSYTFVAFGALAGCGAASMAARRSVWTNGGKPFSRNAVGRVFLAFGIILTGALLVAETFALLNYVDVGLRIFSEEASLRRTLVDTLGLHADAEPAVLFAAGLCWAVALSEIGIEGEGIESDQGEAHDSQPLFIRFACACFFAGLLSRALCVCVYLPFFQDGLVSSDSGYYAPLSPLAAFLPLLFALACFCVLFALPLRSSLEERPCSFKVSAVFFSLGMLCWSCLQRVIKPYEAFSTYAVAVAAAAFLVLLVVWRVCSARGERENLSDQPQANPVPEGFKTSLEAAKLSPRETEAVLLCVEGRTSAESAGIMGIKDATVRSLLQRAYKKVGVASKDELLALAGVSVQEAQLGRDRATSRRTGIDGESYLLWVAVLVCFFVPWEPVAQPLWGMGRDALYGAAFGALCGSVAACFLLRQPSKGFRASGLRGIDCCLYAACVALGIAGQSYALEGAAFGMVRFFVLFGFCALAVGRLCGLPVGEMPKSHRLFRSSMAVTPFLVLLLFMLPVCRMALALVATCFFMAACFSRCGSEREDARREAVSGRSRTLELSPLSLFFLALGFACEESWRSLGHSSLVSYCFAFCLASVVALCFALARCEKRKAWPLCTGLAALCACSLAFDVPCAAIAVALLGAASFVLSCSEHQIFEHGSLWSLPAALGVAVLVSDAAVNSLGDFTVQGIGFGVSRLWGLAGSSGTAAACIALALCLVGLGSLVFYAALLIRAPFLMEDASKDSLTRDERILSYLKSQGATETQALVLVDTAKGMSAASISSSRHFSQGTVSEARWSGYRMLGIHSKAELVETITRNVKL